MHTQVSLHFSRPKSKVKMMWKEIPDTKIIDLNILDMEVSDIVFDVSDIVFDVSDIVFDESHENLQMKDPAEQILETIDEILSKKYHYISKTSLQVLVSNFISQYGQLDKNRKKIVLIKLAINKYPKLDILKKKINAINDSESFMENENDIRTALDPAYNWLFDTVCKVSENGFKNLQEIQTDLLNMFLDVPNMSNLQKLSIKAMKNHVTSLLNSIAEKEVITIPTATV